MKRTVVIALLSCASQAFAQCPVPMTSSPDDLGKKVFSSKLNGFFKCSEADPTNDLTACNRFAGRALRELYGIDDFGNSGGYLSANDIAAKMAAGFEGWKKIGGLLNNENGMCAQTLANRGYPVIAALTAPVHGHVALVLPGSFLMSSNWGNIAAPNSAQFSIGNISLSYVDKPLSSGIGKQNAANANYYYRIINPFAQQSGISQVP